MNERKKTMEKYATNVIIGISADVQLSGDLCPGLLSLLHLALWLELYANETSSASVCVYVRACPLEAIVLAGKSAVH